MRLNKRALGVWPVLERDGYLYLAVPNLEIWRLRQRLDVVVVQERGQFWYPLTAVRGSEIRMSFADDRLDIQVPESALLPGSLPALTAPPVIQTAPSATPTAPARAAAPGSPATQPSAAATGSAGQRFLPMDVLVNGSRAGNWVFLESHGALYAPEDAFENWRVSRSPEAQALEVRGQRWYALSSVPGFESQIDFANQSIDLRFSPKAFAATRLTQEVEQRPPLTPSIPAAFVNYDLNFSAQANKGLGTTRDLGALLELGFSNQWGVLTSSYAGTGLIHSDPAVGAAWRRLETTLTRDFPEKNVTLRVGDSSTRPGTGGRSVYFGGLQIGRNYGLTPGFLAQPIPLITGTSTAPSTVELYVNDALRQTSSVPTGPFTIDNFPLLTGSGQARVVVRDLLGRETVLVQDFFSHSSLLEKGLGDWSFEVGAVRQNLGTLNADYGEHFTGGLYRYGLSQSSTLEARGDVGRDTKGLGLALSQALPWQMLGQFSVAGSRDVSAGSGYQGSIGLEHQSLRHGFTVNAQGATIRYRQLGQDTVSTPTKLQLSASYNYTHPTWGNWGLAFARVNSFLTAPLNTYGLNYSTKVGEASALALTFTPSFGGDQRHRTRREPGNSVGQGADFIQQHYAQGWQDRRLHDGEQKFDGRNGPWLPGVGGHPRWRGVQRRRRLLPGGKALLSADVSASSSKQALRLGTRGGLAVADGKFFTARRIEDSFAIVEVPGYAGVGVGFQGSSLTKTDASGVAILPRLSPYTRNSIRLDPRELPISAEIDNIEQVAVPAARSAVKVVFPVRTGRGALIKLLLDDGEPAPAGAEIELVGDKHEFFVARRGEAFVTGLQDKNEIRLKHNDQTCTVKIELPPAGPDEIVRLGPLTCSGVRR